MKLLRSNEHTQYTLSTHNVGNNGFSRVNCIRQRTQTARITRRPYTRKLDARACSLRNTIRTPCCVHSNGRAGPVRAYHLIICVRGPVTLQCTGQCSAESRPDPFGRYDRHKMICIAVGPRPLDARDELYNVRWDLTRPKRRRRLCVGTEPHAAVAQ